MKRQIAVQWFAKTKDTVRMHCVYPVPTMEKELGEALRLPLHLHKIKTRLPRIRSQRQAKDGAFFNVSYDGLKHRSLTCVRDDGFREGRLPRIRSQRQAKDGAFFNAPYEGEKQTSLIYIRDDVY